MNLTTGHWTVPLADQDPVVLSTLISLNADPNLVRGVFCPRDFPPSGLTFVLFVSVCFCLVWFGLFLFLFGLVWFVSVSVWFGLVWFGWVCFCLVWFGLVCFCLVWFGLVWFGLFVLFVCFVCWIVGNHFLLKNQHTEKTWEFGFVSKLQKESLCTYLFVCKFV